MKVRAIGALSAAVLFALPLPLTVPEPTSPVTGNSTHFDGLGSPYGGCGLPGSQQVANFWNAVVSQAGQLVTAGNAGHSGTVPAGGSATFGMIVNGPAQAPSDVSCTVG